MSAPNSGLAMHGVQFRRRNERDLPGAGGRIVQHSGRASSIPTWHGRQAIRDIPRRPRGPVSDYTSVSHSDISCWAAELRSKLTGPRWPRGPEASRRLPNLVRRLPNSAMAWFPSKTLPHGPRHHAFAGASDGSTGPLSWAKGHFPSVFPFL
jgi:hypothetical protein